MDSLGGKPTIFGNIHIYTIYIWFGTFFQGSGLSFLEPFQADLEPAEWMKIGCLRQEGEVGEPPSDVGDQWRWRSPFQL